MDAFSLRANPTQRRSHIMQLGRHAAAMRVVVTITLATCRQCIAMLLLTFVARVTESRSLPRNT